MRLGFRFLSLSDFYGTVSPRSKHRLAELAEAGVTAIIESDHIVSAAWGKPSEFMTIRLGMGARLAVWKTSMGRLLLSVVSEAAT